VSELRRFATFLYTGRKSAPLYIIVIIIIITL